MSVRITDRRPPAALKATVTVPASATVINGDTCGHQNSYGAPVLGATCPYLNAGLGPDQVYSFYVSTARTVTFSTCNDGTLLDDPVLYIRKACTDAAAANAAACDDDGCSGPSNFCGDRGIKSEMTAGLTPGLYYLIVDGWPCGGIDCGAYQIDVTGL